MTYIIVEPCVGLKDSACVDVCPVDCIYTRDQDDMYYISPDECIDCAACEPVCPPPLRTSSSARTRYAYQLGAFGWRGIGMGSRRCVP